MRTLLDVLLVVICEWAVLFSQLLLFLLFMDVKG